MIQVARNSVTMKKHGKYSKQMLHDETSFGLRIKTGHQKQRRHLRLHCRQQTDLVTRLILQENVKLSYFYFFHILWYSYTALYDLAYFDILIEAGFPIWAIVLIIALSLALFIVIIFILIQHRKKKKSSKDSNPLLGENANNHITLTRNTNSFHAFQAKGANAIQHR